MDNQIKKCLFEIEESIKSIDNYMLLADNYNQYVENKMLRRAVERELEIIGEATNRALKINPNLNIPNARKIIAMRNKIIHGYDEIDNTVIYVVATKYIQILKKEISEL